MNETIITRDDTPTRLFAPGAVTTAGTLGFAEEVLASKRVEMCPPNPFSSESAGVNTWLFRVTTAGPSC